MELFIGKLITANTRETPCNILKLSEKSYKRKRKKKKLLDFNVKGNNRRFSPSIQFFFTSRYFRDVIIILLIHRQDSIASSTHTCTHSRLFFKPSDLERIYKI